MKVTHKNYLAIIITCTIIFNACKKKEDDAEAEPTPVAATIPPAVTAVGTPAGAPATASIDILGGTVTSPDGILELIFPAGSVSAATQVTIQPVTNHCIGGLGLSYSVGPAQVTFNTAVTIRFHYATLDLTESNQLATNIATQLADNTWRGYSQSVIDTINKTVSYDVVKFGERRPPVAGNKILSDAAFSENHISLMERYRMEPYTKTMGTTEGLILKVWANCSRSTLDEPLFPVVVAWNFQQLPHLFVNSWKVNGTNGNSTIGTLFIQANFAMVVYQSPAVVPNPDKVTVTATINDQVSGDIMLLSEITIQGDEE